MKQTITIEGFCKAFKDYDRADNFSHEGKEALYNFMENEVDPNMELDVIAICCDFTEFESLEDFNNNYSEEYNSLDEIEKTTVVIRLSRGRFIIQNF